MYQLMIIDDEPLVLKAISHLVETELSDFIICAQTGSGKEAINLAIKQKPDIILIDIQLETINGLEVIHEINKFAPDTLFYIISAYDNFNYAQKAIRLNVEDYLLKPVTKNDILNLLNSARNKLTQKEKIISSLPLQAENNLIKAIESADTERAKLALEKIIALLKDQNIPPTQFQQYFFELLSVLLRVIYGYLDDKSFQKLQTHKYQEQLAATSTKDKAINIINHFLEHATKLLRKNKDIGGSPLLEEVKIFIEKNYYYDLTLDDIAEQVSVSTSYLSKLFKDKYNVTIIEYLTYIRIEQAAELLKQTAKPICEIANQIGYHDANYFSKVFKKITGQTPTEFRKKTY